MSLRGKKVRSQKNDKTISFSGTGYKGLGKGESVEEGAAGSASRA